MKEKASPVVFVERATGTLVTESVMGSGALSFAYETLLGRTLWPVLFGSKLVSACLGKYYDSRLSRKAIASLASIPGCVPDEAEKPLGAYPSFNAFFTRRLKPGARPLGAGFVSPCDARLRLFLNVSANDPFPVKGAVRTLSDVLQEPLSDDGRFDVAVFRLAPVDYHRFHFPCDCTVAGGVKVIPGLYHSVNPIALVRHPDVYADNERQVVACSGACGTFWMVDVGAFGVGTIVQTFSGSAHAKGDEKGYFKFGGSTVILVLPQGAVAFDDDLRASSSRGLETHVRACESIGEIRF